MCSSDLDNEKVLKHDLRPPLQALLKFNQLSAAITVSVVLQYLPLTFFSLSERFHISGLAH